MKTGKERHYTQQEQNMYEEVEQYYRCGRTVSVGGKPAGPGRVVHACFREDFDYMRDYQTDEQGRVTNIDFQKVRREHQIRP